MPPPPLTRLREIKKRAKVPRLLPRWVFVIGFGVNEKVQNTWEPMPFFSQVLAFIFFLQILSPPHLSHMGSAVFLDIGLTQTSIASAVPPPSTWEPYHSSKRTTGKCKMIVRNKVFESKGGGTLIFLHM